MTLTEGLVILAALVMVVLVGQGFWLVWKSRPRKAEKGQILGGQSLGHAERLEPTADLTLPPLSDRIDSTRDLEHSASNFQARIDPMVDVIAMIQMEKPQSGDAIWSHMPHTRRVGNKSLLLEGLNSESGLWGSVHLGQFYTQLQLAVQMAHRKGVLNEIEYSDFVQKAQKLAEDLAGIVDVEDMTVVIARARELDQFAQAHDAQLVVNLMAQRSTWSIGYIQQVAIRYGLTAGLLPGVFLALGSEDNAPPVVTLTYDAQVAMSDRAECTGLSQICLTFDVAQHSSENAPFKRWQGLACDLATDLDALILDDSGQIIGPAEFEAIEYDLQALYQRLAQYELPAGSPAARRLFS